ncbi:hypothetical protein A2U01_0026945, partial [Trifolium medium]|nr:hypothetical protein [Trifolium medium]
MDVMMAYDEFSLIVEIEETIMTLSSLTS